MRNWAKGLAGAMALGLIALAAGCGGNGPIAGTMLAIGRAQAGMAAKTVETPSGTVHYLEGGKGEPVLLLHGIYARKEHWLDFSEQLTGHYRVIALDLPGFGDNAPLEPGGYRLSRQVSALAGVMDALGLQSAHIAANSMGGQIAGTLAVEQPTRVRSLAFIGSPLGVRGPKTTAFEKAVDRGRAPLVVRSLEDFEARNAVLFPGAVPDAPGAIIRSWATAEVARGPLNQQIWDEVASYDVTPLQLIAPKIRQPALVVWCQQDEVFHPSGGPVLAVALPNAELQRPEDCGHVPMLDKPTLTGKLYRTFLKGL
ncbi:alpha/beta fold hydrolase [Algicella marina]|nr:alpha/beta hydrolase [Algicella marina]